MSQKGREDGGQNMQRTIGQGDSLGGHFKTGYGALRLGVLSLEVGISMPPFCSTRRAHIRAGSATLS